MEKMSVNPVADPPYKDHITSSLHILLLPIPHQPHLQPYSNQGGGFSK